LAAGAEEVSALIAPFRILANHTVLRKLSAMLARVYHNTIGTGSTPVPKAAKVSLQKRYDDEYPHTIRTANHTSSSDTPL